MSKKILILFGILAFYLIFIAYSDFEKFSVNVLDFKFEFLPFILTGSFIVMIIKGIRQQILLEKIKVNISLKNSILLYLAGLSLLVTPGGSGELIKSYFLKKKYGTKITNSFPIVIIERFHDLLAIITIISFTLFFIPIFEIFVLVSIVIVFLLIAFTAMRSKKIFQLVTRTFAKLPKIKNFIENINESYEGFHSLTRTKITAKNWMISLSAWSLDAIVVFLVFLGFNLNLEIIFTTLVMFSSLLIGVLTLLPAGFGVTEVSIVSFLTNRGIEISLAVSIIFMIRLVTTWFATVVGFIATKFFFGEKSKK